MLTLRPTVKVSRVRTLLPGAFHDTFPQRHNGDITVNATTAHTSAVFKEALKCLSLPLNPHEMESLNLRH